MGNLETETESILVAGQNNAIRTNCDKENVDNMRQNGKCRQSGKEMT